MTTAYKKINKTFVLNVLKYGLGLDYYKVSIKDVVVRYNGGENWNCAYTDDWYDLYLPVILPNHRVLTKKDMIKGNHELYDLKNFNNLLDAVKAALKPHFKVASIDLSIGNNMLYIQMCVIPH